MRNVSMLIQVSDEVYDMVVEPKKKSKQFGKLMASLLEGYMHDEYVYAFAEGKIDDMKKASVESLEGVIQGMNQSLSSMGLFTSELQQATNQGKDYFEQKLEDSPENIKSVNPVNNAEMQEIRSELDEVKQQNKEVLDLIKQLLSSGVKVTEGSAQVATTVEPEVEETVEAIEEPEELAISQEDFAKNMGILDNLAFGNIVEY